jgi:SAM-dependent methyltransferase
MEVGVFDRMVMDKFYKNAKTPQDIPWHRDDPDPFLIEVIKKRNKTGRALDLGCGTGSYSVYLAKQGYEVTGLDLFTRALEMGKDRAKQEGVQVNWVEADLFTWHPDRKFDFILDSGCLHSLVGGNLSRYKKQLISWLGPQGDYVLGHWGKKHTFDWLPFGPRRRSRQKIEKLFSPELKEIQYRQELMTGIPKPFGPTVMGMGFWFRKD